MADPFDVLRRPVTAARPDPRFAVELRRRLEEEIGMTTDTTATETVADAPGVRYPAMVHLGVGDADRAMRFFGALLGWEGERVEYGGGIRHYMTNTEGVEPVLVAEPGVVPVRLGFRVPDVGEAERTVVALGGTVTRAEPTDDGGGWLEATDPAGIPLVLWRPGDPHPHDPPAAPATGNLLYLEIDVPDAGPVLPFYAGIAGWPYRSVDDEYPDYHHVEEHVQPMAAGIQGSAAEPGVQLFFTVDDLDRSEAQVAELGGSLTGERFVWGPMTARRCEDDQGTRFVLAVLGGR
jgi:uncharacterized protein